MSKNFLIEMIAAAIYVATSLYFLNIFEIEIGLVPNAFLSMIAAILLVYIGSLSAVFGSQQEQRVNEWYRDLAGFLAISFLLCNTLLQDLYGYPELYANKFSLGSFIFSLLIAVQGNRKFHVLGFLVLYVCFDYIFIHGPLDDLLAAFGEQPSYFYEHISLRTVLFVLLIQTALLIFWRVGATLYIFHASLLGVITGEATSEPVIGVTVALTNLFSLVILNYFVMFLREHRPALKLFWRQLDTLEKFKIAYKSIILAFPTFLLLSLGFYFQGKISQQLQVAAYSTGFIESRQVENQRKTLYTDLIYSIDQARFSATNELAFWSTEITNTIDKSKEELPANLSEKFEEFTPGVITVESCEQERSFWNPKKISDSLCRNAAAFVSELISTAYSNATSEVLLAVTSGLEVVTADKDQLITDSREILQRHLDDWSSRAKRTVSVGFLWLKIMGFIGYLLILGAFAGSSVTVISRVLFDSRRRFNDAVGSFQLAEREAAAMDLITSNSVDLMEIKLSRNVSDWFVKFEISLEGLDTHQKPRFPQPLNCLWQRLRTGKLTFNYVGTAEENGKTSDPPKLTVTTSEKLAVLTISSGKEVVVRMEDLVGFSSNVVFQSIYSAHVGAHALGLGSFYTVAKICNRSPQNETGALILHSKCDDVELVTNGKQMKSAHLLAWDRSTKFSIAQDLTLLGVWFASPDVIVNDEESVVFQRTAGANYSASRYFARMLRYFLIPF